MSETKETEPVEDAPAENKREPETIKDRNERVRAEAAQKRRARREREQAGARIHIRDHAEAQLLRFAEHVVDELVARHRGGSGDDVELERHERLREEIGDRSEGFIEAVETGLNEVEPLRAVV